MNLQLPIQIVHGSIGKKTTFVSIERSNKATVCLSRVHANTV